MRLNNSKRAYELVKDLTTVKQGKVTTVQDHSGKCLTEERQILNRWTEYCSELYNNKANGDPSVLNCTQTDTEDDHPILRREVEAAVQHPGKLFRSRCAPHEPGGFPRTQATSKERGCPSQQHATDHFQSS